jgi:hypothetical protein
MKQDINKFYEDKEDQKFVARIIGEIAAISDVNELDLYIKDVLLILSVQYKNKEFERSFRCIQTHFGFGEPEEEEDEQENKENTTPGSNHEIFADFKAIYRDSRFFQKYDSFRSSVSKVKSTEKNR